MPAAAQRTAGGVFLTFPEDLRPLSAIDYIMYCRSRYIPTSEVGGAEKRLSSPEKRLTAPAKYAILPSALMLVWLSWQSSSLVMSRSPVRIRPQAPKREAKKDIEDKTSVFSRLPRPVDQQIYGPYFSDILPCAIHSGRSRTHTIFTLTGISFEAGILLLQDLGLFFCCRNRFPK